MYDNWEALEKECMNCHKCELCQTRTHVVFGTGNRNAEVMFIGEYQEKTRTYRANHL